MGIGELSSKEKSLLVRRFDPNEEGMVREKSPKMLAARGGLFRNAHTWQKAPRYNSNSSF